MAADGLTAAQPGNYLADLTAVRSLAPLAVSATLSSWPPITAHNGHRYTHTHTRPARSAEGLGAARRGLGLASGAPWG